ncbi:MSCRAMM family adhesin SdrC [Luteolibacter arcticus]|uniref:MSCRAMM family adhesin SdrC n=1 Tax=Luteolibacter arcticus TaxID=1581411 RepID=UPI00222239ED|nr:MSCRAMM family adhesin SdrC [Luteolibacter arcticus]
MIGTESFTYADGGIANRAGGAGFNRDHFDKVATAGASDWDPVVGNPVVAGNVLTTDNSSAKREYNGPVEGVGNGGDDGRDDHERSGAVRAPGRVFYRFTMTRGPETTWSGASSYDFGSERVFFGVPGGTGPATGDYEFGCCGDGLHYFTGIPADTATHTLVAVLDFDHDFIGLWLDPTAADFYDPVDGSNSTDAGGAYTADLWSTAVRLGSSAGGITTWDDLTVALDPVSVGLMDHADVDSDGLPASFEVLHGLDDRDDGSSKESAPGAKDGPNGALGDPDRDKVGNLAEYGDGTFPDAADSDLDRMEDAREKSLGTDPLNPDSDRDALCDSDEVDLHSTDPLLADSDGDGTADFTEVALGSALEKHGNMELVGLDFFDDYTDGTIAGFTGGRGWDYDNVALPETFTGHTTLKSPWTSFHGAPVIKSGTLLTRSSSAKRAFHGGSASAKSAVGELSGAWQEDAAATGVNGSNVLYVKVNLTRQEGVWWSGFSLYDFDRERIYVGVPFAANPQSGQHEFAIEQASDGTPAYSGIAPVAGSSYTLVARFDFANSRVDLRVNPDLAAAEESSPIAATLRISPAQMKATGIRLGSGGTGATIWDQLVVGTAWNSLQALPSNSGDD